MKIFDSHCHLDDKSYNKDIEQTIIRAHEADVKAMMAVGINLKTSSKAIAIAEAHDHIYASVGVHPHDAEQCSEQTLSELKQLAAHPKVKAWGETGLDFNRMYSPTSDQEHWFNRQLELGTELGLAMIFHERESRGRFLQLLKTHWSDGHQGVVHCFSGNDAELDAYLALGLFIGITGILTIQQRGRQLRQMVQRIPNDRLVVETDAPYLTPAPEKNKTRRNEPAFVRTVLMKLAEIKQESPETMAAATWDNTCRLFGIAADSK